MYICDIALFYHVSLLICGTEINQSINQSDGRTAPRTAAMDTFRRGAGKRRYENWNSLLPEHITF